MNKIVIYGVGKVGRRLVDNLIVGGFNKLVLTDSDDSLWGKEYNELKICNPDEVQWHECRFVIIAAGKEAGKQEIHRRLAEAYGVSDEKIIYGQDFEEQMLILSENETYNLGNMVFNRPINETVIIPRNEIGTFLREETFNELERFFFKSEHKGINKWLHYFEAYDRFFSKYRGRDVTILEIGVFKGGSLQMWKEYFKMPDNKIQIYGVDIDPACKALEEENIKIFIGSQEDREFLRKLKKKIGKVDILIDDGGHTMNQQIVSFEELFDLVDDEGIYLCEDLHTSYMESYGGRYKGDTFIEYSKNFIDFLNAQYSETAALSGNVYCEQIKAVTYYDSMLFIEKKRKTTKSIWTYMEN